MDAVPPSPSGPSQRKKREPLWARSSRPLRSTCHARNEFRLGEDFNAVRLLRKALRRAHPRPNGQMRKKAGEETRTQAARPQTNVKSRPKGNSEELCVPMQQEMGRAHIRPTARMQHQKALSKGRVGRHSLCTLPSRSEVPDGRLSLYLIRMLDVRRRKRSSKAELPESECSDIVSRNLFCSSP